MIDRIFSNIERIFRELRDSRGAKALEFSKLSLEGPLGVLRSLYWLVRIGFKPP